MRSPRRMLASSGLFRQVWVFAHLYLTAFSAVSQRSCRIGDCSAGHELAHVPHLIDCAAFDETEREAGQTICGHVLVWQKDRSKAGASQQKRHCSFASLLSLSFYSATQQTGNRCHASRNWGAVYEYSSSPFDLYFHNTLCPRLSSNIPLSYVCTAMSPKYMRCSRSRVCKIWVHCLLMIHTFNSQFSSVSSYFDWSNFQVAMVSVHVPPYVPPRTRLLQLRPDFFIFFALSLLMFSFLQDSLLCFSKQRFSSFSISIFWPLFRSLQRSVFPTHFYFSRYHLKFEFLNSFIEYLSSLSLLRAFFSSQFSSCLWACPLYIAFAWSFESLPAWICHRTSWYLGEFVSFNVTSFLPEAAARLFSENWPRSFSCNVNEVARIHSHFANLVWSILQRSVLDRLGVFSCLAIRCCCGFQCWIAEFFRSI